MTEDEFRQTLRGRAKAAGKSLNKLSKKLGKDHGYLYQYIALGSPRKLDGDFRAVLEAELGGGRLSEADWVYRARTFAKLTQEELAAKIGASQVAVSRWEAGELAPSTDHLVEIAAATGVTASSLERVARLLAVAGAASATDESWVTCEACCYWARSLRKTGTCRYKPPVSQWPQTLADDWCGQFAKREAP